MNRNCFRKHHRPACLHHIYTGLSAIARGTVPRSARRPCLAWQLLSALWHRKIFWKTMRKNCSRTCPATCSTSSFNIFQLLSYPMDPHGQYAHVPSPCQCLHYFTRDLRPSDCRRAGHRIPSDSVGSASDDLRTEENSSSAAFFLLALWILAIYHSIYHLIISSHSKRTFPGLSPESHGIAIVDLASGNRKKVVFLMDKASCHAKSSLVAQCLDGFCALF